MLQWEHSAVLLTFIKLPFAIKTLVLSIFEWQLKTGFTVFTIEYLEKLLPIQAKEMILLLKWKHLS